MKRAVALFMAVVMVFALCACGKSNEASGTSQEADESIVDFENVILVDNNIILLELVNFYAKDVNRYGEIVNEKYITLKATNMAGNEILLNQDGFYINNEKCYVSMVTGSISLPVGKSGTYSYMVSYDTIPEATPLESFEPLYKLEGSFSGLNIFEDSRKNSSIDVEFSIPKALNGEIDETSSNDNCKIYSIGDTVSTDTIEFTLTGFDFVYHLDPKTYAEKDSIAGGSIGPGNDMVFANPEYDVTNVSKTKISVDNSIEFTVNYNDGYLFNQYDNVSYMVDSPSLSRTIYGRGSSKGISMDLSPLSRETYESYLSASDRIDTDSSASVLLVVSLANSTGTTDFTFRIR